MSTKKNKPVDEKKHNPFFFWYWVFISLGIIVFVIAVFLKDQFLFFSTNLKSSLIISTATLGLITICYGLAILFAKRKKLWFNATIILMAWVLVIGLTIVLNFLNFTGIHLILRDYDDITKVIGRIDCVPDDGYLKYNTKTQCSVEPSLSDIKGAVIYYLPDNLTRIENFSDLSFTAPSGTKRIKFALKGINNGKNLSLVVANDVNFVEATQVEKKTATALTVVMWLIAGVFVSIPSLMNNIKNLFDQN
ncbi:hypothetical protein JXM83_06900 [Candidatus Woesearchaeota archaeon]|nr:hypothetical protein [Candidatus Woesearchaeota archaeon]